ncbi:hypothetical protein SAMN04488066_101297 [Halorubrum aquaticum]|uniref:Uncharacterized protein n=1 Tax=Halorubrum aquaticum TaxID=387340 RepID=A0A1I2Z7Q5_9EURY|nr:hypothetical protein [Halorubrum aquaticum]SFH33599.1 hypothetical protein SAMN04488066_101297 [Halorubrum aquaticum]
MELSRADVEAALEAYRSTEPLYTVESEAVETMPDAFRSGEYGRRDAQWVVRWYGRRYLGDEPADMDRSRREDAFEGADFEAVRDAISTAVEADRGAYGAAIDALTTLPGVDLPVASAFLAFVHPNRFVVVGPDEWAVVRELTGLEGTYPDPPSIDEYDEYLAACDELAERCEIDPWEVYMLVWRRRTEHAEP